MGSELFICWSFNVADVKFQCSNHRSHTFYWNENCTSASATALLIAPSFSLRLTCSYSRKHARNCKIPRRRPNFLALPPNDIATPPPLLEAPTTPPTLLAFRVDTAVNCFSFFPSVFVGCRFFRGHQEMQGKTKFNWWLHIDCQAIL